MIFPSLCVKDIFYAEIPYHVIKDNDHIISFDFSMTRVTVRSGYQSLVERLNRYPQGATPVPTLFKILQFLITKIVSYLENYSLKTL